MGVALPTHKPISPAILREEIVRDVNGSRKHVFIGLKSTIYRTSAEEAGIAWKAHMEEGAVRYYWQ
jgi:hypothetical protein